VAIKRGLKLSGPAVPINRSVSLFIPLTAIGIFAVLQLLLGASLVIVAMCAAATTIPFLYLGFYGRDLYGVLGIGFGLQYPGVALVAKTIYGQTLESNLYDAYAAFGLILLLMFVLTAMLVVARTLDWGEAFFRFPRDLVSLRRLSVACICIGLAGDLAYSTNLSNQYAASSGGACQLLAQQFGTLYYLGLIAEAVYAVVKTDGRSFVTRRLLFLFIIQVIIFISFNERGNIIAGLIGIVTVMFLYNTIYIRHVIIGILVVSFFVYVFTPITLFLRASRGRVSLT
jgi:hypothetical protein